MSDIQQAHYEERIRELQDRNALLEAELAREHSDNAQTIEDAAAVVRENSRLCRELAALRTDWRERQPK